MAIPIRSKCEYCDKNILVLLATFITDEDGSFENFCRNCKKRVVKESLKGILGK